MGKFQLYSRAALFPTIAKHLLLLPGFDSVFAGGRLAQRKSTSFTQRPGFLGPIWLHGESLGLTSRSCCFLYLLGWAQLPPKASNFSRRR